MHQEDYFNSLKTLSGRNTIESYIEYTCVLSFGDKDNLNNK
jgi:hypothetical protein